MKKIFTLLIFSVCVLGCDRPSSDLHQGYVEGEFVYIASPSGGVLESLAVTRGVDVTTGQLLFALDSDPEGQMKQEAESELAQAKAILEDKKKGSRPSELDAIRAQQKQAAAAFALAEEEYRRQERLSRLPGVTSKQDFERARSSRDQARFRMAELDSLLATSQLGARADEVLAAEAKVQALTAVLDKADWNLAQKRRVAPEDALVFDTLYRRGEWVPSGRPVISLLPPANIKVRAFIPETQLGKIKRGDSVDVYIDGIAAPVSGSVSYISPQVEFTPPVIYSKDSRAKFVFMVEIVFASDVARSLHPGQPVDVRLKRS